MKLKRLALPLIAWALALAGPLYTNASSAQSWPAKPVRVIVPYATGGVADMLGRLLAQKLSDTFQQPLLVENRGGAGGIVGSELTSKAAPDGYTLLISGLGSLVEAPALSSNLPYDAVRDFTHIALIGGPPMVLVVNPSVPVLNMKELIALARARPGTLSYATAGSGSHGHLVGEMFKQLTGIAMTHIPYKGAGPAMADLIAGHVPVALPTLSTAATQIRAGKARPLAVTSAARLPDHPGIPTFLELGFPDLVAPSWFSLSGPAQMPQDIVLRLNSEVRRIVQLPDIQERMRPEGIEAGQLDPQAFTAFVAAEYKRWAPVLRAIRARAD
jgi:tripartite-type tricarboxylate transporter receptor subunit TctC